LINRSIVSIESGEVVHQNGEVKHLSVAVSPNGRTGSFLCSDLGTFSSLRTKAFSCKSCCSILASCPRVIRLKEDDPIKLYLGIGQPRAMIDYHTHRIPFYSLKAFSSNESLSRLCDLMYIDVKMITNWIHCF